MRCARCGYWLTRVGCPICDGRQIKGMEPVGAIVPRAMRAFFVVPDHFESPRHYRAWCAGIPMRSDRGRWKVPARTEEMIRRHFKNRCQWPGGCAFDGVPTLEHIVPVAFGGSNHPGNLTLLCSTHQTASWNRFQQLLSPNATAGAA